MADPSDIDNYDGTHTLREAVNCFQACHTAVASLGDKALRDSIIFDFAGSLGSARTFVDQYERRVTTEISGFTPLANRFDRLRTMADARSKKDGVSPEDRVKLESVVSTIDTFMGTATTGK